MSVFEGLAAIQVHDSKVPETKLNRLSLFLLMLLLFVNLLGLVVSATPVLNFTSPTPNNNSYRNLGWVYINVSVNDSSNTTAFIDWNRSLVGWWRFNQESGENNTFFRDFSSYGNNGTCTNCPNSTSGKFGGALYFDGADDYIRINDSPDLDLTSFTLEAWISIYKYAFSGVFAKGSAGPDTSGKNINYALGINATGHGGIAFEESNGTDHALGTVSIIPKGGWVHLAGSYDYDTGMFRIYINGMLDNEKAEGSYQPELNNQLVGIGNGILDGVPSPFYKFNGTIDEMRVWNRALSPEEINASYNAGLYGLYHNFTNLIEGVYNYTAYAQDLAGDVNQTETRTLTVDTTPPASVTNLTEMHVGTRWIEWKWTNPTDPDFNHTEAWINGVWRANTTADSYTATGLNPKTGYEIQTRTVDHAGNPGEWVNDTINTLDMPSRKHHMNLEVNGSCVNKPVTVKVLGQGDKPLDDVGIDVLHKGEKTAYGLTNREGIFEFNPEAEGTYLITAIRSRYYDEEKGVNVSACEMPTTTTTTTTTTTATTLQTTSTTTKTAPGTTEKTRGETTTTRVITTTLPVTAPLSGITTTLPAGERKDLPWAVGVVVLVIAGGGVALYLMLIRGKGWV